jgi:hypothetical protein
VLLIDADGHGEIHERRFGPQGAPADRATSFSDLVMTALAGCSWQGVVPAAGRQPLDLRMQHEVAGQRPALPQRAVAIHATAVVIAAGLKRHSASSRDRDPSAPQGFSITASRLCPFRNRHCVYKCRP